MIRIGKILKEILSSPQKKKRNSNFQSRNGEIAFEESEREKKARHEIGQLSRVLPFSWSEVAK